MRIVNVVTWPYPVSSSLIASVYVCGIAAKSIRLRILSVWLDTRKSLSCVSCYLFASVIWKIIALSTYAVYVPEWVEMSKVKLPDLTRYIVFVTVSERCPNLPLPLSEWTLMEFAFNSLAITESEAYDGGEFGLIWVREVWGKFVSTEGDDATTTEKRWPVLTLPGGVRKSLDEKEWTCETENKYMSWWKERDGERFFCTIDTS